MASGSQNMTTYLAKQVIGSNAAANPAGALLQSGANRADDSATGDTWIFLNTVNSATNPWGIFHSQVDNKIKIIGDGTDAFWVDMDTGDTYILGNLSTGSVLTVRAQNDTHEGGEIVLSPATDSFSTIHIDAYDSMFRLHDGTNERFKVNISSGNTTINGNLGIGADYAVLGGSYKLYVNGTSYFNDNIYMTNGKTIGAADTQYRPFQLYLGRNTTSGSNALNSNNPLIEFSNSDRSQYCQLIYDDWDSLAAPDSLTLVGNQNGIFFICKNGPIWIQGGSNAGGNINRLTTASGMPGNMQYNTSHRGTQIYSNGIAFADPYNGNSNNDAGWIRHLETTGNSGTLEIAVGDDGNEIIAARQYKTDNTINRELTLLDANGNTYVPGRLFVASNSDVGLNSGSGAIVIGSTSGTSIGIDDNEIMARSSNAASTLYINSEGGNVYIGSGGITSIGTIKSTAAPAFLAETAAGTWSYLRLHSGSNLWDIATKSDDNSGCLDFRPGGASNKGPRIWTSGMMAFASIADNASYSNAAIQIREQGYGGSGSDTWGRAPRLAWHWSGRVAAQIGLASNGYLYTAPSTGTSFYKLVYESGTWGISITGSAGSVAWGNVTGKPNTFAPSSHSHSEYVTKTNTWTADFNTCTTSGFYRVSNSGANRPGDWGQMIVCHGSSDTIFQLYHHYNNNNLYVRGGNPSNVGGTGSWSAWAQVWRAGNSVTSAVWNDYAEARESLCTEPGRTVQETGSDTLTLMAERLAPCAGIVSDTWGFSQGETDSAKTHIAVAGRVLAYPYRNRNEYKPGDVLCAAPGGTVDIMTREEIRDYPDRIVGTVSCIPEYEEWGGGENADRPPVKVNGRIWVKVK